MPSPNHGLLFYSAADDPAAWRAALGSVLPDAAFYVYPNVPEPAAITTATVWDPPGGFFEPLANLRLIVNLGAGVDKLLGRSDLPKVPIVRLSDAGMISLMTSYVLFAVIRYARDIDKFESAQRQAEWHYIHPRPLSAIKVGILGLGELGRAAAAALAQLGFDVYGWSRSPKDLAGIACAHGFDALDDILSTCEILVILLPLTAETRGLIGETKLRQMRKGAKLINVARGGIVDENALIDCLSEGHLAGATLDVFAQEPLPADSPLWRMTNVLITPHLASNTVPETAAKDIAENIRRLDAGAPLLNQIDPKLGY
jgi:glyoxylate/hydroxypyruvate reductase A